MLSKPRVGPGAFAVRDSGLSLLHDFDRDHTGVIGFGFLFFRRDFFADASEIDNSFLDRAL